MRSRGHQSVKFTGGAAQCSVGLKNDGKRAAGMGPLGQHRMRGRHAARNACRDVIPHPSERREKVRGLLEPLSAAPAFLGHSTKGEVQWVGREGRGGV